MPVTSGNITVEVTETGWKIVGVAPYTSGEFVAELPACDCDRKTNKKFKSTQPCAQVPASIRNGSGSSGGYHVEHVEVFVKRVAATYQGKTTLPKVPVRLV